MVILHNVTHSDIAPLVMFNEMLDKTGRIRPPYSAVANLIEQTGVEALSKRNTDAEAVFRRIGITFSVYGDGSDPERLIPFDVLPRVFSANEWALISKGVMQRSRALNAFLFDVYNRGEIIRAGLIPQKLVYQNSAFLPDMVGIVPTGRVYSHIVGTDIIRTDAEGFFVLEDNCRTPSGVSYMLENREVMMRIFPECFASSRIAQVDDYPAKLLTTLQEVAPSHCTNQPNVVLLTPGSFNSAYYEHSFLADLTGIELVEPADLFVDEGLVWMRTTRGPQIVDVIYRRIDDDFIDPVAFRPDSLLGVPGLFDVYRAGGVTLCSAPGAGIADDKAIYTYVPEMIRFYLGEVPILKNVPTYRCSEPDDLKYVRENIHDLVVKEVHGSGGYGMLIGPKSTKEECEKFASLVSNNPANYIAQPMLDLSSVPTLEKNEISARHVDFRPFCLVGKNLRLCSGGLSRVALKQGSVVVNSSQGGGVKDTWILME